MASKSIDIKCPECGASGRFEIWNSIDLEENPPLEEKARSGALFRYACPECGIITKVAYPTLIHDSANKRMIYLATDKEMFDSVVHQYSYGGSSAAGGLLEGDYMVRVVKTVPELSELLRIIHAGLDDRVAALLKLFVFQEVSDNNPDYEFDNLYFMDRDDHIIPSVGEDEHLLKCMGFSRINQEVICLHADLIRFACIVAPRAGPFDISVLCQ